MKTIHDPRYRRLVQELIGTRRDAGFTQVQVAQALRWRRSLLSNIETCQRRADVLEVFILVKLYGVKFRTLEVILDGPAQ